MTEIDLVVNLKLREDVLIKKCLGRRVCGECGKGFNVASINIKAENGLPGMIMPPILPPHHCASKLVTRADDTEPVVKERIRIYKEKVTVSGFCAPFIGKDGGLSRLCNGSKWAQVTTSYCLVSLRWAGLTRT